MFKISANADPVQSIAAMLANGQRRAAACKSAEVADKLEHDELVALVRMLSDALETVGDKHPKRGRPKIRGFDTPRARKIAIGKAMARVAAMELRDALTARRLLAGKQVAPRELAIFALFSCGLALEGERQSPVLERALDQMAAAIRADPVHASEQLLPHATVMLREMKLSRAPLQGFIAHARAKIASRHGLTDGQIKRAQ